MNKRVYENALRMCHTRFSAMPTLEPTPSSPGGWNVEKSTLGILDILRNERSVQMNKPSLVWGPKDFGAFREGQARTRGY